MPILNPRIDQCIPISPEPVIKKQQTKYHFKKLKIARPLVQRFFNKLNFISSYWKLKCSCRGHKLFLQKKFWTLKVNYSKTKQDLKAKLGTQKAKINIYFVYKNEHKILSDSKVFNIWNIPAGDRNLWNAGLGLSEEPEGCSSTITCFDISVHRSFSSKSVKSVALVLPEIIVLNFFIFYWIHVWRSIVTLLCLFCKNIFWSPTLLGI